MARSKSGKTTPLMRQFAEMKAQHPDAILLYRVGDFYETFGQDAETAAGVLGITLTSRNNGGSDVALAGFPHHALDAYLPKLVRAGYRVAVCEQLEKPTPGKKVVRRGITELVTPGVAQGDNLLEHKRNNFLAAVAPDAGGSRFGVAFTDISTGEFLAAEGDAAYLDKLLENFAPAEVVLPKGHQRDFRARFGERYYAYPLEDWIFADSYGRGKLLEHFRTASLKGFGIEEAGLAQGAAGAILHYLAQTNNSRLSHLATLRRLLPDHAVWLDRFTVRNLELVAPATPGGLALVDVLDATITPMGARLLRRWVVMPLARLEPIRARHDLVAALLDGDGLRESVGEGLRQIGDLERLAGKLATQRINPRELRQVHRALAAVGPLARKLADVGHATLERVARSLDPCDELAALVDRTLREEAPSLVAKGDLIAVGVDPELDGWRDDVANAQVLLNDLRNAEAERTGIASLKVGFNNVFGYYFEVSNKYKNQGLTPDAWVRKQSLANAERYISEELKALEERILGAGERIQAREEQLFAALLADALPYVGRLQATATALAGLDCVRGFAELADRNRWVRPTLTDGTELELTQARHPVIEAVLPPGELYVPNDLALDRAERQILMVTGPNMSGKSALLRQTALAVVMAQAGCFVTADAATLGLCDKVFTRVGASDNLSSGESTFMVEMHETASIMNNVSARSLVLLDEIGRGTSTFDGVSIAWAIVEYLHAHPERPKTLFATHYHELNALATRLGRIANVHVSTQEAGDRVIFLRTLAEGGSRHSFGIHVARMAGVPTSIVVRAGEVLAQLERQRLEQGIGAEEAGGVAGAAANAAAGGSNGTPAVAQVRAEAIASPVQLSIFEAGDPVAARLRAELERLDVNNLTPVEAMRVVLGWREMI